MKEALDQIRAYFLKLAPEQLVQLAKNSKHLKLTPKILLKAKQKAESLQDHHFNEENSTKISVGAVLNMDQAEPVIFEKNDSETNVVYGGVFRYPEVRH